MTTGRMGGTQWVALVVLSVLWGGAFFFIKVLVAEITPFTVVLARVGIAAVVLWLVILTSRSRIPKDLASWGAFALLGVFNNVIPFSLITWGETAIGSGLAAILNATTPLFTIVLAHFLTQDEPITANRLAGILLGIAGVALLVGFEALAGFGRGAVFAQLGIIGAALSYGCAVVFSRRIKSSPLVTSVGQLTCATIVMLPVAFTVEHPLGLHPNAIAWGALLGLAIPSTSLAYLIYFRIVAVGGATNAALVTILVPISALVLGVLFLRETLALNQIAGMVLILFGLTLVDGRLWLRARSYRLG